jgi:Uri superfamily endonuclease
MLIDVSEIDRFREAVSHAVDLPDARGAYLLIIVLANPIALSGRFAGQTLGSGRYLYAGSAYGPGGIRARVGRHMKQDKKIHWHVDQLTACAASLKAVGVADGNECALINDLQSTYGMTAPLPGFGSTDCTKCVSHLICINACSLRPRY